jgi:hypothetical protein
MSTGREKNWKLAALQRNLNLRIPRKRIVRGLSPNFRIHVSVSDLYIVTFGPPIFMHQNRQTDQRKIQTAHDHECKNLDCSRAVPFMGIFVSNFRYCVFAVWFKKDGGLFSLQTFRERSISVSKIIMYGSE